MSYAFCYLLFLLFSCEDVDLVVHGNHLKGLDEKGHMGVRLVVDDPWKSVLMFGLDGEDISPVSQGNELFLIDGFQCGLTKKVFE
jgi:hypothetical protein